MVSKTTWIYSFIALRLFFDGTADFFVSPTAWTYIRSLGQTEAFLGIVLSSYAFAALISGPLFGRFHDRFGYTKFIIASSSFIKVVGYIIYAIPVSAYCPLVGLILSGLAAGCDGVFFDVGIMNTPANLRTKSLVFLDGMYMAGTVCGPAMSSFLMFKFDIFGWKIDHGNSPGFVLFILYLTQFISGFWLPDDMGTSHKGSSPATYEKSNDETKPKEQRKTYASKAIVMCVFYQMLFTMFVSMIRTFYVPLFAQQLLHIWFIDVKLLFVVSCGVQLVTQISVYQATEYMDERLFFLASFPVQLVCIAVQFYFAMNWYDSSTHNGYVLLIYAIAGGCLMTLFSLGCSIISKMTDPADSSFYQASCFTMIYTAFALARLVSGFLFTQTSMLYYNIVLAVCLVVGMLWFFVEYRNIGRHIKSYNISCAS